MPCYDPRNDEPLKSQLEEQYAKEAYARGDWDGFYRNVTKRMLEQWLCDALPLQCPARYSPLTTSLLLL